MSEFVGVIPLLIYRDIPAAMRFLVDVLGFEDGGVEIAPNGEPLHGEVRVGEVTIWLHGTRPDNRLASPDSLEANSSGLVVYVGDVQKHFERVKAAGGTVDSEPEDRPYGQREYGVRDPEGHRWWFATRQ
jgi:uncharacterized glyoxalase superfamily protein PhnB